MEETKNIDASKWVDDYADAMYNYAFIRVQDMDLAKDLVQDTFVSALNGIDGFQGKSSVKTWLYSILKRKIIDHWRKNESRKTNPFSYFVNNGMRKGDFLDAHRPSGKLAEIEEEIENEELKDSIMHCISLLPEKWRGIVMDKLVDKKESEEVCNDHDITPSNLWVIIHRSKIQLRECLEKKWFKA